jgi:hypothetical protein
MSLAIFTQTCAKNVSGASKIFIADKATVTAVTVGTGEITAITGTTPFMRVDTVQDSLQWKEEEGAVGLYNAQIKNTIDFNVLPPSKTTNVLLQALMDGTPCGFFAIIIDSNGSCWLVGHNATDLMSRPLRVAKITHDTGKGIAVAEGNQLQIELANDCSGLALPFNSAMTATIVGGTDTCIKWT